MYMTIANAIHNVGGNYMVVCHNKVVRISMGA